MAYEYIGKALCALPKPNADKNLPEWVARKLNALGEEAARKLDDALSLNVIDARKALAGKVRAGRMLRRLGNDPTPVTFENCELAIRAFNPPAAAAAGVSLNASFWGFANTVEREWMRDALNEAKRMALCARYAFNTSDAKPLVVKWFGALDAAQTTRAIKVFDAVSNGVDTNSFLFTYLGAGLRRNDSYEEGRREWGVLKPSQDGWGFCENGTLAVTAKFFEAGQTAVAPQRVDGNAVASKVTRGGAILHELTHKFSQTVDFAYDVQVFFNARQRGLGVPGEMPQDRRTYGPVLCTALAARNPEHAITNADNYRLFAEEAFSRYA